MTTIPVRQPRGIPVGGQFAPTAHAEPATTLAPSPSFQAHTHTELLSDRLNPLDEAKAARAAIYEALDRGEFGEDAPRVRSLRDDDRLVRLAVDRYVVAAHQDPESVEPEKTGARLGQMLVDLHEEDIEDAVYGLEWGGEE